MEQFVVKMLREKEDLEGKIKHLGKALDAGSDNNRISKEERELCEEQISYMKAYLGVLEKRISLHNN